MTIPNILLSLWKIFLASLLALTLTGCLPVPIFEVTPSTARAGTELTFDASGSVVAKEPKDNVAAEWSWEFGDGGTAKGKTVTHTYEKAGTYTIKLAVTDSAGRSASIKDPLIVKEALTTATKTTDTTNGNDTSTSPTSTTAK